MLDRRVVRLSLLLFAIALSATIAVADERKADAGRRFHPSRAPLTPEQLLRHDLAAASAFEGAVPVGEASATDPVGDLNVNFIDTPLRGLSGGSIGETIFGDFVSGANFELARGGCFGIAGGVSDFAYFAWQKGTSATGGNVLVASLSGSPDVTYSVSHSSLTSAAYKSTAGIVCERLTADFQSWEDYYQFTMSHIGQGQWHGYYAWLDPFTFDGKFDMFELPIADLTTLSATEVGGLLEITVTVAGAIPSAGATTRPAFWIFAKPSTQTLGRFVAIESRGGEWRGILHDYSGSFPIAYDVRTDLSVTVSGNSATIRVDPRDLLLSGSNLSITAQAFTDILVGNQLYRGRADIAGTALQLTEVTLGRLPDAMVQPANVAGATTELSLINNGANSATVALAPSGSFFALSTSSVNIAPGEAAVVTITGNAVAAGDYSGSVSLSGPGLAAGTAIPVRLLSVTPPAQPPLPRGPIRQDEVQQLGVNTYESRVEFTNEGLGTVSGLLSSDVPWIIPQSAPVSIAPGGTQVLTFTVDRTKRFNGNQPGSSSGNLSLAYLNAVSAAKRPFDDSGTSLSTVVVTDTAKPPTSAQSLPPLVGSEVALFLAGVDGAAAGWVTDINVIPGSIAVPSLSMFYVPEGGSPSAFTVNDVSTGSPITLADAVRTVFDEESVGTMVLRGSSLGGLQVSGVTLNIGDSGGTFGTTIPVFRSDRGAKTGETWQMTGLAGRSAGSRTDLFLQEVAGLPTNVTVDFLNAAGSVIETSPRSLGAFAMIRVVDAVPAGAVTAIITVVPGSEGKVAAHAMPVDLASGDRWVTSDWPRMQGYDTKSVVLIPVAGSITGINGTLFRSGLSLFNPGDAPITVTLIFHPDSGSASPVVKDVLLNPKETKSYTDVVETLFQISGRALGYIRIDPKGVAVLASSRTWSTTGNGARTFGMGVPVTAASRGIKLNGTKRINTIEDAAPDVFLAKTPATFRTNLGLLETGGASATVQVTLNYEYAKSGSLAAAKSSRSKTYVLAPNSFRLLVSLTQEILEELRETLDSSIRSMSVDVKVTEGTGTVEVFASSVDNASGDQHFKME